jgi:Bacterial regulatory helix-turn-helix proteins, AraC family.
VIKVIFIKHLKPIQELLLDSFNLQSRN